MEEMYAECNPPDTLNAAAAANDDNDDDAASKPASAWLSALPFRFELLARSLICAGGYTVADIVQKESAALCALITSQSATLNAEERLMEDDIKDELKSQVQQFFGVGRSSSSAAHQVCYNTSNKLLFFSCLVKGLAVTNQQEAFAMFVDFLLQDSERSISTTDSRLTLHSAIRKQFLSASRGCQTEFPPLSKGMSSL